jgi:hypothetical protein
MVEGEGVEVWNVWLRSRERRGMAMMNPTAS